MFTIIESQARRLRKLHMNSSMYSEAFQTIHSVVLYIGMVVCENGLRKNDLSQKGYGNLIWNRQPPDPHI